MDSSLLIGSVLALGLLYLWARDHHIESEKRRKEREEHCPHLPEWQETCRVNNILTMNPGLVNAVIPGRRWLIKKCRGCGRQRMMYRPTLQPFDEFIAEFDQETIDRAAQLQARTQQHINARANAERARQKKRDREMS